MLTSFFIDIFISGDNDSLYSGDDQNDTLQTRKRFSEIVSTSSTKSSNISSRYFVKYHRCICILHRN